MDGMKRFNRWMTTLFVVCFVLLLIGMAMAQADCRARGGEWIGYRNAQARWVTGCTK